MYTILPRQSSFEPALVDLAPDTSRLDKDMEDTGPRLEPYADGPVLTYHRGGATTKIHFPRPRPINTKRPRRGVIKDFSRRARSRLLDALNRINRPRLHSRPLFVTLTYPEQWPSDPAEWKRHLDVFAKRLVKHVPSAAFFWKLEFQSRGAPHFHLLVFNTNFLPYQWLARAWYEVVNSGDLKHLAAGTEVRRIKSWRGVLSYAAKYMTKPVQLPLFIQPETGEIVNRWPGRFWGCVNRAALPVDVVSFLLTWEEAYRIRREIWRYRRALGYKVRIRGSYQGVAVYVDSATIDRLLQWLVKL